jgi:hypothetical protein
LKRHAERCGNLRTLSGENPGNLISLRSW